MVRLRRAGASSAICLALALAGAPGRAQDPAGFDEALARADARFAARAEGAAGALALPGPVDGAIAGYREALRLRPDSLRARGRLLRSLFFRATFCGAGAEERKAIFEDARRVAEDGTALLDRAVGRREGAARIAALRELPDAGELLYWAAVAWGEWGLGRGKLAAASAGVPGRVRDLAQAVIDVDPELQEAGGYRILGRLHDQSPRIPLVSGFVSRDKALLYLRKAHAAFSRNSPNQFFLAEAILRHEPAKREEARRLLRQCAEAEPQEAYRVEDAHFAALARSLLASLR